MSQSILVIDDFPPLHKLVRACLEDQAFIVHSALDGEEGLLAAERYRPGLILLDVDMPRMNGLEVYRRLKADQHTADIPVVFLTACAKPGDSVQGAEPNAFDFLSKPFKPEQLRVKVRENLRVGGGEEGHGALDSPAAVT
jgi:DNA-binding response OmpR family regulator